MEPVYISYPHEAADYTSTTSPPGAAENKTGTISMENIESSVA
jgi:hypothetical protein